jgi:hypothetical protein
MAIVAVAGTVRPATAQIAVIGDLLAEHVAVPGETYQGAITIRNTTNTIQVAALSLADYRFDAGGANWFDPPGSNARSNTGWVTLSQQAVSLPPQGTQVVRYTVAVPASTPRPLGTYWSVVLVEGEDRSPVAPDPQKFVVTPKIRYAVQVATHIVGEARECRLAFGQPRVQPGELAIDISDSELRACRPNLRLEVYNGDGELLHTATLRGAYLYPATSVRQKFALPTLSPGGYSFLLVADVGADKLQGAKFQVQVP